MRQVHGFFQRCVWLVTFLCLHLFTNFYVKGRDNIKLIKTPLLVVANHRSYWDSMIIGTLFPFFRGYMPYGFMAADELCHNVWYKIFFLLTGTRPAYKGCGLDVSLEYPREVLKRRGVFIIFPFGQRVLDGDLYPRPGRGAAKLVQEFPDLSIFPIYLKTTPFLNLKSFLFGKKEMGVFIGKPLTIPDAATLDMDLISQIIVDKILSLHHG